MLQRARCQSPFYSCLRCKVLQVSGAARSKDRVQNQAVEGKQGDAQPRALPVPCRCLAPSSIIAAPTPAVVEVSQTAALRPGRAGACPPPRARVFLAEAAPASSPSSKVPSRFFLFAPASQEQGSSSAEQFQPSQRRVALRGRPKSGSARLALPRRRDALSQPRASPCRVAVDRSASSSWSVPLQGCPAEPTPQERCTRPAVQRTA